MGHRSQLINLQELFNFCLRYHREKKQSAFSFNSQGDANSEFVAAANLINFQDYLEAVPVLRELVIQAFHDKRLTNKFGEVVLHELETENVKNEGDGFYSEMLTICLTREFDFVLRDKHLGTTVSINNYKTHVRGEIFRFMRQWTNPVKVFTIFIERFSSLIK